MVADWGVEGRLAPYALHKIGQLAKYLSAAKLRIRDLAAQGQAVAAVQIHIHYISDSAPTDRTKDAMEREIKKANLADVTIFWGRI